MSDSSAYPPVRALSQAPWSNAVDASLQAANVAGQFRRRRIVRSVSPTEVIVDGCRLVNFASNDYLGLAYSPVVRDAMAGSIAAGAGAAALITGYAPHHAAAEAAIAEWKGAERCVLLPSGYQANLAAVQAMAAVGTKAAGEQGIRFLIDKLVHASLIDAVRATSAGVRVFAHNDMAKLRRLLISAPAGQLQVVVTESIFSMDGDAALLHAIAALKDEFGFALLLDEAHASGIYGPGGAGLAAALGLSDVVDLSIATLSKAIGVSGGAVCGTGGWIDAVINFGRAGIFTTNVPPGVAGAIVASLQTLAAEPQRAERLHRSIRRLRGALATSGVAIAAGDSPIIPITLGSESAATAAAKGLEEQGYLVVAIRPPTVPRGGSRLRVTLSSEHTDAQIDDLLAALRHVLGR